MSTIFERCGGFAAVSKVVMAFYEKVLDSDIAGPYFEDVDMKALIDHQTKFVAQVMGGPVEYNDEVLRNVHAKHKIDREAFDEVARLMKETLEDFDFDPADVKDVMRQITSRAVFIISA
jgi:hemoglobin